MEEYCGEEDYDRAMCRREELAEREQIEHASDIDAVAETAERNGRWIVPVLFLLDTLEGLFESEDHGRRERVCLLKEAVSEKFTGKEDICGILKEISFEEAVSFLRHPFVYEELAVFLERLEQSTQKHQ
ncbi:MAG: uncharacterized protein A8A55_2345 [Amphiamblys sp. WSBS2006]|nr:MAG: uncharacterized protein A8A55_2345 [Amphiamblys sp. WSBS2006]